MIIEKLEIKNFGRLHNREIILHRGMNVLYGENEEGKSTTHAFIRSMFFGLERSRGKGARTDLYTRYQPWDSPTVYRGAMEFSCDGKRFRLERDFYSETRSASLVCLEDGEHLSVLDGDLDMLLGGINPAIFDNTVSVGQLKSVTGRELAEELKNYIANYQGGADGDINPGEAMEQLKENRRFWLQEKRNYQEECREQLRQIDGKLQLLEMEQQACMEKIRREEELLRQYESSGEDMRAGEEHRGQAYRDTGTKEDAGVGQVAGLWKKITVSWAVVALAALLLAVIFRGRTASTVLLVMACAAGIQIPVSQLIKSWLCRKLRGTREKAKNTEDTGDYHAQESAGKLVQLREDYQERQIRMENLQQERQDAQDACDDRTSADEEIAAVELAMDMLRKSTALMENSIGSRLRQRMGEILSEITDGRYTSVCLEEGMNIRLQTIHRQIELYQLSRGTLDQVYFALRMAAGEVLCGQEPMPVILDEVFALYDDGRLKRALEWLERNREQTILFTCQKRENEGVNQ